MKSDTTLSKSVYLNVPTVKAFVHYVASLIDGAPFKHVIVVRDPKLPANDPRITNPTFVIESLESAFDGYWWDKQGYEVNAQKLRQVQVTIRSSIKSESAPNGATAAIHALSEVLEWGAGGRGQSLYTDNMMWAEEQHSTLIDSLRMGRAQMMSDTPNINVFKSSETLTYARMNAGFTKYYALACDNVVIYDGRVGAALGLLAKTFCKENQIQDLPNELAFRWGAQKGTNPLNRDPSDGAYKFPQLRTSGATWAEWNIKANWILSAAQNIAHAEWCKQPDGLRRLEAALFVIGYQMPSIANSPTTSTTRRLTINTFSEVLKCKARKKFTLVPTGHHDFEKIIKEFFRLRMLGRARTHAEFVTEMYPDQQHEILTKKAYLFPLKPKEFDLLEATTDSLQLLLNDSLTWLNQKFNSEGFSLPDERRFVCLQNVWLVGYMNRHLPNSDQKALLVKASFAGNKDTASLIRTVGKNVGAFFKLLDEQNMPTEAYDKFFCQDMSELESKLLDAANAD